MPQQHLQQTCHSHKWTFATNMPQSQVDICNKHATTAFATNMPQSQVDICNKHATVASGHLQQTCHSRKWTFATNMPQSQLDICNKHATVTRFTWNCSTKCTRSDYVTHRKMSYYPTQCHARKQKKRPNPTTLNLCWIYKQHYRYRLSVKMPLLLHTPSHKTEALHNRNLSEPSH